MSPREAEHKKAKPDPAISIWGHVLLMDTHTVSCLSGPENEPHTLQLLQLTGPSQPWLEASSHLWVLGACAGAEAKPQVARPPTPLQGHLTSRTQTSTHDFSWEEKGSAAKNNKEEEKKSTHFIQPLCFVIEQTGPEGGSHL